MGGINGLFVIAEKLIIKPKKKSGLFRLIYAIITLLLINFQWIFFRADNLNQALHVIRAMVIFNGHTLVDADVVRLIREYWIYYLCGIVSALPLMRHFRGQVLSTKTGRACVIIFEPIVCLMIFLWACSFLILGTHNPFIYFNF